MSWRALVERACNIEIKFGSEDTAFASVSKLLDRLRVLLFSNKSFTLSKRYCVARKRNSRGTLSNQLTQRDGATVTQMNRAATNSRWRQHSIEKTH